MLGQEEIKTIDSVNNQSIEKIFSNLVISNQKFQENAELASKIVYTKGKAKSYAWLAIINYLMGRYDISTEYNIKAILIFEELKDYQNLADTYGEYGYQMKRRDPKQANEYMLAGIKIARTYNVPQITLAKLLDNYGVLKEMENKLDSALYYYNQALIIKYKLKDSVGIPYSLNKIANCYSLKGNYNEALRYLKMSDLYRAKEKGDYGRADNLAYYGDVYSMKGLVDSAIVYYEASLELSKRNNYTFLIEHCLIQLAELYKKKNDLIMAYDYSQKYNRFKDSVMIKERENQVSELSVAFETNQKEKLIKVQDEKIKQRTFLLVLSTTFIMIILILFFIISKIQRQKNIVLNRELRIRSELFEEELKRKLAEENLRVSRELHDNIGSQLTFIINSMDNISHHLKTGEVYSKVKYTSSIARRTLNELRNTIWAIRTGKNDLSVLVDRINDYIFRYKVSLGNLTVRIINNTKNSYQLSSTQLLNLFRIFQESLQNTIKHSNATEYSLCFEDIGGGFLMKIEDNGIGIDLNNFSNESSGIISMKYRCQEAGGNFKIYNRNGADNETGLVIETMIIFNK